MKINKSIVLNVVGTTLLLTSCSYFDSNIATTPDEGKASRSIASVNAETPAQETVCNELIGATPGLYGLCVAYCEAQDGPEVLYEDVELTDQEISTPNRKLLTNYDKKMREGDSRMPCVNYKSSCPVWTEEELDKIGNQNWRIKRDIEVINSSYENFYDVERNSRGQIIRALVMHNKDQNIYTGMFLYRDYEAYPLINIYRSQQISQTEYNACKQQLLNHITAP